ncbi:MAG: hypothetical protein ACRC5R_03040 [Mycoplasmatales bacterium]
MSTIENLKVDHDFNPRLHDVNNYSFNVDEMINLIIDNGWLRESIIQIGDFDEFKDKIIQGNKRVTALKIINNPEVIDKLKYYNKNIIFSISNETIKKINGLTEYEKHTIFDKVRIERVKSLEEQKKVLFELNEFGGHEKWSIHAKIKFLSEQAALYPEDLEIFTKLRLLINEHGEKIGYFYAISNVIKSKSTNLIIAEEIYKILNNKILGNSILNIQDIKLQINENGIEAICKNDDFYQIILNAFNIFDENNFLRISDKESFVLNSSELSSLLEFDENKLSQLKNKNSRYNKTKKIVTSTIDNIIKNHLDVNYDTFKNTEIESSIQIVSQAIETLNEIKYIYKSKAMFENLSSSIEFQTKRSLDAYLTLLIYKNFNVSEIQQLRQGSYLSIPVKYKICQDYNILVFKDEPSIIIDDKFLKGCLPILLKSFDAFIVENTFVHQVNIKV